MRRLVRAALITVAVLAIAATIGSAEALPAHTPALLVVSAIALVVIARFVIVKERANDPR